MPYRTFTRNQLLVSFLSKMRSKRTGRVFLESRGEGVRKILEGGEAHSGRRPEYELFGNELRLTVWGGGEGTGRVGGSAAWPARLAAAARPGRADHLAKAKDACLAAVTNYNRPGTAFRTRTYTVLMVIAWTALFHAIFHRRGKKPWYVG